MHGAAIKNPNLNNASYFIVDQGASPCCESSSRYIFTDTRGLSKSRNIAINECSADILLISDDDVRHFDEVEAIILSEFARTGADILTFQITTPEGHPFKTYNPSAFTHSARSVMRVNSIEIAVRVKSVKDKGLKFDEEFGLGARYPTGEEIIFLSDALKAGLNVRYVPVPIVVHPVESSGGSLFKNDPLIGAKGAMFCRIFGFGGYFACTAFAVKHHKKSGYGFLGFMSRILKGAYEYRNGCSV